MDYALLKSLHVAFVVASGCGFALRGALMLRRSPLLATRVARVLPHFVDTLLLAAAIGMLVIARMSPLAHPWLMAKIIALLAYIVLGAVALRRGRTPRVRALAFAAALATFAYIVGVALAHDPLSWWALWLRGAKPL